jgi:hypothetical protein
MKRAHAKGRIGPPRIVALASLLILAGCSSDGGGGELAKPSGPPSVDPAAVLKHATQFDEKLPVRTAGSQEEEIATSYLLAHMQQAGYLVRLDGVPVRDQVRSTNVIAPPPSGEAPTQVFAVRYDTFPEGPSNGEVLGLWLEMARALNVKEPDHTVEFVALGADHADLPGAPLGQRRLATFLKDAELEPSIVLVEPDAGDVLVAGPEAHDLARLFPSHVVAKVSGGECLLETCPGPLDRDFDLTTVSGPADVLAPILLRFLAQSHS